MATFRAGEAAPADGPPDSVPGTPAEAFLVRAERAGKRYGAGSGATIALREVSLAVAPGDFLALMGRSGCGKSTLLNLLGAMDLPTTGRIFLAGRDTRACGDDELTTLRRSTVGFVFQAFHLLPTLTVRENIEVPLLLLRRRDRARRVAALAERVELGGKLDAYPGQLSGGEMQRVALARAVVHEPRLIIADEPTGNLDSHSAASVMALLRELSRESGAAVVMATHSAEAAASADHVLHLRDGAVAGEV